MLLINKDRVIYALSLAIEAKFDEGDWIKLGYEIDEVDAIEGHHRLLRSLSWRDPDYTQNIIAVLKRIGKDENKLVKIADVIDLEDWLYKYREDLYRELYEENEPEHIIIENTLDVEKFDLAKQLDRIYTSLDKDPELALGTTKEMLETVMKTILNGKVDNLDKMDIPELIKAVRNNLVLIPESLEKSSETTQTLKRTLSNLGQIVIGIGELRNAYGTGHGKIKNDSGLKSYHTRLAVNSGVTLIKFLIEVYEDQGDNSYRFTV